MKNISDWHLAARLAEVLHEVSLGETYEVTRAGRPIARITGADVGPSGGTAPADAPVDTAP